MLDIFESTLAAEGVQSLHTVMAMRKIFAPPVLSGSEDFENWLQEIEIWGCVTELKKKKQGPAIYLSEGRVRKSCEGIDVKALNADNGFDVLTNELKEFYAQDTEQATFIAYQEFERYQQGYHLLINFKFSPCLKLLILAKTTYSKVLILLKSKCNTKVWFCLMRISKCWIL